MLARDYDYENRWDGRYSDYGGAAYDNTLPQYDNALPQYEEEEVVKRRPGTVRKEKYWNRKALSRMVTVAIVFVIAAFGIGVFRSSVLVSTTNELVALQKQEMDLKNANEALNIEVEKLKSPGRITAIATGELGMRVARSNIYVKSGKEIAQNNGKKLAAQ